MSIIKYEPVHIGDFSSFIENLVSKTKSNVAIATANVATAKANALNTDSLQRAIRRAKATEEAKIQSQGGDSTFGTGDARLRNVMRQGAEALARKDLNFQTTLNDFVKRRKNVGLETLDKNNRAFSGLSSPPSATGLVTNLAGLGISTYADVNYYTAPDGTIKSRTFD